MQFGFVVLCFPSSNTTLPFLIYIIGFYPYPSPLILLYMVVLLKSRLYGTVNGDKNYQYIRSISQYVSYLHIKCMEGKYSMHGIMYAMYEMVCVYNGDDFYDWVSWIVGWYFAINLYNINYLVFLVRNMFIFSDIGCRTSYHSFQFIEIGSRSHRDIIWGSCGHQAPLVATGTL